MSFIFEIPPVNHKNRDRIVFIKKLPKVREKFFYPVSPNIEKQSSSVITQKSHEHYFQNEIEVSTIDCPVALWVSVLFLGFLLIISIFNFLIVFSSEFRKFLEFLVMLTRDA